VSIFGNVFSWFGDFFGFFKTDTGKALAKKAITTAELALPYVEFAAKLTPTFADDEVIAVLKNWALPIAQSLVNGAMTTEQKKFVIGQAVATVLQQMTGLTTTQANIATNLAYLKYKTESASKAAS
jgi:hypothetical protein